MTPDEMVTPRSMHCAHSRRMAGLLLHLEQVTNFRDPGSGGPGRHASYIFPPIASSHRYVVVCAAVSCDASSAMMRSRRMYARFAVTQVSGQMYRLEAGSCVSWSSAHVRASNPNSRMTSRMRGTRSVASVPGGSLALKKNWKEGVIRSMMQSRGCTFPHVARSAIHADIMSAWGTWIVWMRSNSWTT